MKKFYKSPLVILALGVLIIGASSVGATRAAIVAQTTADQVNFSTAIFSVNLTGDVENGNLTFPNLEEDGSLIIGKQYPASVSVENDSNPSTGYNEYVRVVVRKSWKNADGSKNQTLDPNLIQLTVNSAWQKVEDTGLSYEYEVYYLPTPLDRGEAVEFLQGYKISDKITDLVTTTETTTTITNEYVYNGESASISIQADAVQTKHPKDAIYAAWGMVAECTENEEGIATGPITLK